ncbi:MAG: tRNA (N(6)-L-threonylcarbamoyladenosine(37)-C(2))-methylthiotransferase MtaB, partial [Parasporobacterium sp.]|nr:tRNA (N(6)-L-threonylcarbamoyladenosine(37)-C(2))-methylthiotransferase MtaB [Parasporobacterium sp.]
MKAAFHTLGCKVNSYETRAVSEQFKEASFDVVDFSEKADVYVINSCSVTAEAARKSRQITHRAKKLNPDAVVVVTGCYAQEAGEELVNDGAVDLVVGNNRKSEILPLVLDYIKNKSDSSETEKIPTDLSEQVSVSDLTYCRDYESQSVKDHGKNVRAYVKIQDGCDRFCAYCLIPYVRGRSRSRDF